MMLSESNQSRLVNGNSNLAVQLYARYTIKYVALQKVFKASVAIFVGRKSGINRVDQLSVGVSVPTALHISIVKPTRCINFSNFFFK